MLAAALKMIPRTMRAAPAIARAAPTARMQFARTPMAAPTLARTYASGGGLTNDEIRTRIEEVLKSFEKVDPAKVTPTASFTADLGLDSLDAVEVVMAIEEEFNIVRRAPLLTPQEIPDVDADNITNVQQAIDYISHTSDGAFPEILTEAI
ncbi:mitochondrial acyl carrier protein [Malassezia vespertilionis]|uniref:mitochondrial acyl carrier protein n=1 Tax=Malassezia vespertilionis TaxID=2020962 RepID=UPI0024B0F1A2|nr:mitochondrial acyl carrier protein [Malassezia vespertilionis]WFD07994.1 mitochondrial acyl carrier protein [Malassezia vespertilionis]